MLKREKEPNEFRDVDISDILGNIGKNKTQKKKDRGAKVDLKEPEEEIDKKSWNKEEDSML